MIRTRSSFDDQPGVDMLSELPLSIIHIILSLVPFKDAVRTSILSRNWRYKWTSLPNLVFNCEKPVSSDSEERLKNFITHALSLHEGPIHKFEMSVLLRKSCPNMDEWLLCLSRKDITELIINKGDYGWSQRVHSCIYSCNKLTYLELQFCDVGPPPSTFKGFLFLRCLILVHVDLSSNGIESLVANCPLLERFELAEVKESELRISAPNLKYLYLYGDFIEIYLHAPLLAEMWVYLRDDDDFNTQYQPKKRPFCNYTNFMGGLTNLKMVKGEGYFTKTMSIGIESCHQPPLVFHQLRDIELNDVDFLDVTQISVLARLLIGAPNLHKLNISMEFLRGRYVDDVSLNDFGFAPNFTLEKLKIVKVIRFKDLSLEKEFIKFLLENSPVLETMRIGHTTTLGTDEIQSFTHEFLACSLASPTAKITIFSGYAIRSNSAVSMN